MRHARKLWVLLAIGSITYAWAPVAEGAAMGSIRGFVKDDEGKPLAGAAVMVLAHFENASPGKIIKRASTNQEGQFIASGITPGQYRIKAEADGFTPVELAAQVVANKATIFESIRLRQVSLLSERTRLDPDPKYSARHARSSELHFDEKKVPTQSTEDGVVALVPRSSEVHGVIHSFVETTPGRFDGGKAFLGANFAVSQQIGRATDVVISGQAAVGDGAPQRLEALTAHSGERHRLSVALGYGRFTFSRRGTLPRLGQFSLSATDTWQVSGPILVVYGLEVARFTEGATGTSLLPRLGFAVDATARTRLFAGVVPGSSVDEQSKVEIESGEIVLPEAKPVAVAPVTGEPIHDRSYRIQVGGEQILSDKSSVEMMAFVDTVTGHGVGLLAIPVDTGVSEATLRTDEQRGRTKGLRIVYHRRMNKILEGSVGYAFGEGQHLDERGVTDPARLFGNSTFHVFSAKIDATFIGSGTRVSTVLRLAPEQAVFAIDPFQGQLSTYDPNVSVSLTQALPVSGLLPGHWEAMVDLRNLLDQQAGVSDERQELIASRFHRLVRVGLSVRF